MMTSLHRDLDFSLTTASASFFSSSYSSPLPPPSSWHFDVTQYKLVVNVYVVTTLCVFGILGNVLSAVSLYM